MSMVDFVINKRKELLRHSEYKNDLENYANIIYNYAQFLKQSLNIGIFVPCDEDGNVLEEPIFHEPNNENEIGNYEKLIEEYYEAKEKVLFEGFEIIHEDKVTITIECNHFQLDYNKILNVFSNHRTIEDLAKYNFIELTENAIKQIGL